MNLKKHLDRAEQALQKGRADFAAELCDQVLDMAPGEARAAGLLAQSAIQLAEKGSGGLFSRLSAASAGLAAGLGKLTRRPEAEASARRRGFLKNPGDFGQGYLWADALERSGEEAAALEAFAGLASVDGESAKRAGALASAIGQIERALEMYEFALAQDPRDTEAIRARKNLAAEQALRKQDSSDDAFGGLGMPS